MLVSTTGFEIQESGTNQICRQSSNLSKSSGNKSKIAVRLSEAEHSKSPMSPAASVLGIVCDLSGFEWGHNWFHSYISSSCGTIHFPPVGLAS